MKITKVDIVGFRKLANNTIAFDDNITLVVGKNNTGKTSLIEIFHKFFGSEKTLFKFEDFSVDTYSQNPRNTINFYRALENYKKYHEAIDDSQADEEIESKRLIFIKSIPKIVANIYIQYNETDDLSCLSNVIMDLDSSRQDALISCEFSLKDTEKLFRDCVHDNVHDIVQYLKDNLTRYYAGKIYTVDEKNRNNKYEISKSDVEDIFLTGFVYAQRNLDDQSSDNQKNLSKGFETFYKINNEKNLDSEGLNEVLGKISEELDDKYKNVFSTILKDLQKFGTNTNLQQLVIKSHFEPKAILRNNTMLFYNHDENELPESYNVLGFSNLIYIVQQFLIFYKQFNSNKGVAPAFQLLFIEEPESHLHAQMQYIFIRNIKEFIESKKDWNVQIVITTHSSHIVSESEFSNIRYFADSQGKLEVKNLSDFQKSEDENNIRFLRQYMSLKKCDMFFADKIIMIEGVVERLLLPIMMKKIGANLLSEYISIIEVGGAYAHKFKEFLKFLNIKTLIITDIDSVDSENRKSCEVSTGNAVTSNQTLKQWLPKKENITDLLNSTDDDKVENNIRVAYQISEEENSECGRSFEEAFIIANQSVISKEKNSFATTGKYITDKSAYNIAEKLKNRKTDFAFDIMMLWNNDSNLQVPKYIKEGLSWLEK